MAVAADLMSQIQRALQGGSIAGAVNDVAAPVQDARYMMPEGQAAFGAGRGMPPPSIGPGPMPQPYYPEMSGGSRSSSYPSSFVAGVQGGKNTIGQPSSTYSSPSLVPGSPQYGAVQGAVQKSEQAAKDALARLSQGQFTGTPFAQGLYSMFSNPQGISQNTMRSLNTQLAESAAGERMNTLQRFQESARAKGFGDSLGAAFGEAQIRGESARGLSQAQLQLALEDELRKQQQQQFAGSTLPSLYGLESQQNIAAAQGLLGRQFPVIPGITSGGGAGSYGGYPSAADYMTAKNQNGSGWSSGDMYNFMTLRQQEERAKAAAGERPPVPVFMF